MSEQTRFEIDETLDRLKGALNARTDGACVLDPRQCREMLRALHALRVAYGDLEAVESNVHPDVLRAIERSHPFGRAAIVLALEVE